MAKIREGPTSAAPLPGDVDESIELPEIVHFEDESVAWGAREMVALLGLTVVAAVLRLFRLHEWSFWVDEAHTLRDTALDSAQFWSNLVSNYPLSYLTLRSVIDQLPELSEGWLRLPFAFFGILTVPLVAIVGRGLIGSRGALLAALFLAIHPWHIYWSQNARGYALMLPFAILSIGLFWSAIQRGSKWLYLFSALFLAAAGFTHPTAFMIAGVFVVVWFLNAWHRPGIYRTGLVVWSVVIGGGLLAAAYPFVSRHVTWFTDAKSTPSLVHFAQTSGFFFRVPLTVAAAFGFIALRRGGNIAGGWFLALWAVVPMLSVAVLSLGFFQVTAQYVFFCLPAVCLLAAALCVEISRRIEVTGARSWTLRFALPVLLFMEMGSYDALYYSSSHGDRPRWREAATRVSDSGGLARIVLTTNEPSMQFYLHPEFFWGAARDSGRVEVRSIETWNIARAGDGADYMRDMQREAHDRKRGLVAIFTYPELAEKDPDGTLRAWLHKHARQLGRFPNWTGPKDMTVEVYEVETE